MKLKDLKAGDDVQLVPDGCYQKRLAGKVAKVTATLAVVEVPALPGQPRRFRLADGRPAEVRYQNDFPAYRLAAAAKAER